MQRLQISSLAGGKSDSFAPVQEKPEGAGQVEGLQGKTPPLFTSRFGDIRWGRGPRNVPGLPVSRPFSRDYKSIQKGGSHEAPRLLRRRQYFVSAD
jgi:hypothetical protein